MTNVVKPVHRTVRFWACGGTGIDLLRDYRETAVLDKQDLFADELDTYVDTSDSNMHDLSVDNVFRIPNIDGGGKDREKVKATVGPILPEILLKHPAGDLNVILFSLSGGTGSAIGPLILGHLLKGGHAAVGIVLADHTSSKSAANAINSLTDLESIAMQLDKPVVLHYSKNDPTLSVLDNDAKSKFVMSTLSILGSGRNMKLDSSDVNNFFNFTEVTHHKAGLAQLHVTTEANDWGSKLTTVASFAALLRDEISVVPSVEVDYDAVGYLPNTTKGYDKDFYYAVTPGMNTIVDALIDVRKNIEMRKAVNVQTSTLSVGGKSSSFDGNTGMSI